MERFGLPGGVGPEDVVVDADGGVITGADDGRIWRWRSGLETPPDLVADTGGRPLGIEVDPRDGSLVVCDADRGLLRVTPGGAVTVLADTAAGRPIVMCDNAAVARDGTVYFTDSSDVYPVSAWKRDMMEYRPNGRLLAYDPGAGAPTWSPSGSTFPTASR